MKRTQRGMTLVGFVLVLAVAGVFAYMGMKLVPMYSQYFSVKQALKGLGNDPSVAGEDSMKIRDLLFRRLETSYVDIVKPENVKVTRKDAGYVITVDYQDRRPLIANLDVVGNFHAEQELRRRGVD